MSTVDEKDLKKLFFAENVEELKTNSNKMLRKIGLFCHPDKTIRVDEHERIIRTKVFELINTARVCLISGTHEDPRIQSVEETVFNLFLGNEINAEILDVDLIQKIMKGEETLETIAKQFFM
jgi:hypothetical protein